MKDLVKPLYDHVIVSSEKRYRDTITTESGNLTLWFDPMFKPTNNKIIKAVVVGTPHNLQHFQNEGIDPIVQAGDLAYFHYNTLGDNNVLYGTDYYACLYDYIFCVVREGKIIPVGDWCLVEKIYPADIEWIDDMVNPHLGKQAVRFSGLIVSEVGVKHLSGMGRVAYAGRGRSTQPDLGLTEGMIVKFHPDAEFENEIEGRKYFCVRQEDIISTCEGMSYTLDPNQKV